MILKGIVMLVSSHNASFSNPLREFIWTQDSNGAVAVVGQLSLPGLAMGIMLYGKPPFLRMILIVVSTVGLEERRGSLPEKPS